MWGRNSNSKYKDILLCLFLFTMTPFIVIYSLQTVFYCDSNIFLGLVTPCMYDHLHLPDLSPAISIFIVWILLQIFLALIPDVIHLIIPSYQGGIKSGSISPGGYVYKYNINGFQAWLISITLFIFGSYQQYFPATIIYDNWGSLLIVATIIAYLLTFIVYIKAHLFPNNIRDRKFTTSRFYDYFMGIELNPRIYNFDLKLFLNGRPGIIAWSLINLSFTAAQYKYSGFITNSILLVNYLQLLYVGYFFYRESWYLKTLDISHDHFGWMFSFGDLVWLPSMYTLQALYLVNNPIILPFWYLVLVSNIGLIGFLIFALSNNQKDEFKSMGNSMKIHGRLVKSINCTYVTVDGHQHESKLLISGWWGLCRHINYTGDILLSLAYSLACGYTHIFPYFYVIYLTMLLVHRTIRDEAKCSAKYGKKWYQYCKLVPYRFIPGLI